MLLKETFHPVQKYVQNANSYSKIETNPCTQNLLNLQAYLIFSHTLIMYLNV